MTLELFHATHDQWHPWPCKSRAANNARSCGTGDVRTAVMWVRRNWKMAAYHLSALTRKRVSEHEGQHKNPTPLVLAVERCGKPSRRATKDESRLSNTSTTIRTNIFWQAQASSLHQQSSVGTDEGGEGRGREEWGGRRRGLTPPGHATKDESRLSKPSTTQREHHCRRTTTVSRQQTSQGCTCQSTTPALCVHSNWASSGANRHQDLTSTTPAHFLRMLLHSQGIGDGLAWKTLPEIR